MNAVSFLAASARTKRIVRIHRKRGFAKGSIDAFVLDVSGGDSGLSLLMPMRDRLDLDGYDVLRNQDIARVEASPKESFYRKVLKLKKQSPVVPKGVSLRSLGELVSTVSRLYGLVVINRERVTPGEVEIGRVVEMGPKSYRLEWVTTTAEFESDERVFKLRDITMVQFGGDYEQTLATLVGAWKPGPRR